MQYLPAGQVAQSVLTIALAKSRYFPAGHNSGMDVARGQYRPVGHAEQSFACVAPVVSRYVPAAQSAGVCVAATQYLPDGQGRHAEAATPFVAGLYVPTPQSICSPTGQYFPAGQFEQLPAAVALAALHVPAGHTVCVADASGQ